MDRFLFPMDKVELTDISEQYVLVNLLGKESDDFLQTLGFTLPEANHQSLVTFKDFSFYIAHGNDLGLPGYTLILTVDQLTILQDLLQGQGGIKMNK